MRYLLLALLLSTQVFATETIQPAKQATYSAGAAVGTTPATPTDLCQISGNATRSVAVTHIVLTSTQGTAGINTWYLTKRSKADSGGGVAAMTVVPHDTNFPAAYSTPNVIPSPLPSLGPSVGDVRAVHLMSPATGSVVSAVNEFVIGDMDFQTSPIVLHGTGDSLSVNFKGAALPTGLSVNCNFTWTEY